MEWIDAKNSLPDDGEIVLLTNSITTFIGFRYICKCELAKGKYLWWAKNPNIDFAAFLVTNFQPTHWSRNIQPERLNEKAPKGDAKV
jgi:hypothetical protein